MSDESPVFRLVNPPGYGPIIRVDLGAGAGAARDVIEYQKATAEVFSVNSAGLPDPGGGGNTRQVIFTYGDLPADQRPPTACPLCRARGGRLLGRRGLPIHPHTGARVR